MAQSTIPTIEPGKYEHYKGNTYEVIGTGVDSETKQPVVIYKPLYDSEVEYWVRPYEMFVGTIEKDGTVIQRFKKVQ